MATLTIDIRGTIMGQVRSTNIRNGYSLFCADCGEVWAKFHSDATIDGKPFYHLLHRSCPDHAIRNTVLPLDIVMDPNAKVSSEVLRREFAIVS